MLLVLKNKLTIGTNFAIGETRFRLPLHLLRFTVRSSPGTAQRRARARTHDHSEAGCTRAGLLVDVRVARRRSSNNTRELRRWSPGDSKSRTFPCKRDA